MKFFSFILAAGAAVSASAHNYTRCSNEYVAPEEIAELNSIVSEAGASGRFAAAAANIRVYAHVVTTEASRGRYTQSQINEQISILNAAYVPLEYTFTLVSTDFTVNNAWARASLNTAAERNLKTALKRGTYGELDLYFLSDIPSGGLGWATFPVANPSSSQLILDGAVNLAGSLPRGDAAPFNLGATAVHEVGHWTGLFHVFQGQSCTGAGDSVADTPPQSTFTSGCPRGKDSCSGGGVDSINNWMDYSDDACMDRFTPGQITRATTLFDQLRAGR